MRCPPESAGGGGGGASAPGPPLGIDPPESHPRCVRPVLRLFRFVFLCFLRSLLDEFGIWGTRSGQV
jgi:hypothetical protein